MEINKKIFGMTAAGDTVTAYQMANAAGASVTVLDYGATVQSLRIPNRQGTVTDVVLGYDTVAQYETDDAYLGATIGRVCNRIGKGIFSLGGKTYHLAVNCGPNHSHGGLVGFNRRMWSVSRQPEGLKFSLFSPDGEEGYPGNLRVSVTFSLSEDCVLTLTYDAEADQDTILNMTSHCYYNLNGTGTAMEHELQIFAERFLQTDRDGLPTGAYLDVAGTPFDFRMPKRVSEQICGSHPQLTIGCGYDHTYALSGRKAAVLKSRESGISMTITTDLPGMQLYSANHLTERMGKNGAAMMPRGAICLETQLYPDGMAHYGFPSPVIRAGEAVQFKTEYAFRLL